MCFVHEEHMFPFKLTVLIVNQKSGRWIIFQHGILPLQEREIIDNKFMHTFFMVESPDNHPVEYIPHADGAVCRCGYQTQSTDGQCSYGSTAWMVGKIDFIT